MLWKEKRRVLWSLAIGAVLALGVYFWPRVVAFWEARPLRGLVAACKTSHLPLPPLKERAARVDTTDELAISGYVTEEVGLHGYFDDGQLFASENLHAKLADIIKKSEFAKLDPGEKREVIESLLHADKDFSNLSAAAQAEARRRIYDSLHLASLACDPDELSISEPDQVEGIQQQIFAVSAQLHAEALEQDDVTKYAALVFGFFCLPLVWYFLMDRLREISAAISGRDQSH